MDNSVDKEYYEKYGPLVCGVDEGLNDRSYIVPGLGDAGDRLYGVVD